MSNLMASLSLAAQSLDVFQYAMGVTQNNVSNASTAGYATQSVDLAALSYGSGSGEMGGVGEGTVQSSRNQAAEQAVRTQTQSLGYSSQMSTSLSGIESSFDITGNSGIDQAMTNLMTAFSSWSASPSDSSAQQTVLGNAQSLAQSINQVATTLGNAATQSVSDTSSTVSQINTLADQIAKLNSQISADPNDANLDADMTSSLDQLSSLVNFSTLKQSDGTLDILVGGQTALVAGAQSFHLSQTSGFSSAVAYAGANAPEQILDSSGNDITSEVTGGQLGALVDFHNNTLGALLGNGTTEQGSLNVLAQGIADTVNNILTGAQTSSGTAGVALFNYDASQPSGIAATLSVSSAITADQLAPVSIGPPTVANGAAARLAALGNPTNPDDLVNGQSITALYSSIATNVGTQSSNASSAQTSQSQLVTQAQNLVTQMSGVSLDDQAAVMLQFQRGYDAASRLVSIIDQMNEDLISMVSSTTA
jgi:flagellar hook-associated protein 1 FlgK